MTRIFLINPLIRPTEPPRHAPYGLALLAAVVDQAGLEIGIIDCNANRIERELILRDLKEEVENDKKPADIIGIGGLITTYGWQKDIIPWIRKDFPDTLIVAGGGCATSLGKDMLRWNPELDMLVMGEGEKTFMDVINHVYDRDFSKIKGIIYRDKEAIVETEPRPLMTEAELNQLPYPAWNLLDMNIYFQNSSIALSMEALQAKRRIDLITERGCAMNCNFCTHNGMGGDMLPDGGRLKPVVRWQSAKYVVNMMKHARIKMAIDFVSFLDENFLANRKRTMEICDLLEKEDMADVIKWGCLGSAQTVDPKVLTRIKSCGCVYADYGFESADQRMLDSIGKGIRVEQTETALKTTIDAGINPVATYMIGFEKEDLQSIFNTTAFWVKHGIICMPFFITPYPGTRLFNEHKRDILYQFGADSQEWQDGWPNKEAYDKRDSEAYEKFILALGDATKLVVNLTKYSDPELLGLRDLMTSHDLDRIKIFAKLKGETIVDLTNVVAQPIQGVKEGGMGEPVA